MISHPGWFLAWNRRGTSFESRPPLARRFHWHRRRIPTLRQKGKRSLNCPARVACCMYLLWWFVLTSFLTFHDWGFDLNTHSQGENLSKITNPWMAHCISRSILPLLDQIDRTSTRLNSRH